MSLEVRDGVPGDRAMRQWEQPGATGRRQWARGCAYFLGVKGQAGRSDAFQALPM